MATRHIGVIVTGCLIGGLVAALALVVGPVAGAQEHVITGTVLLTFSASWALLATLSMLHTEQPQRWAFALAGFMALAGAALLVFAPSGVVIDALGWVWPPLFLALIVGTVVRVHRHLHSRTRYWVVYPLLVCTPFVLLEGVIKPFEKRSTAARMWRQGSSLMSADTGFICTVPAPALPPSFSNQGWVRRAPIGDGFRRRSHQIRGYARMIARAVVGVIRLLPSKTV